MGDPEADQVIPEFGTFEITFDRNIADVLVRFVYIIKISKKQRRGHLESDVVGTFRRCIRLITDTQIENFGDDRLAILPDDQNITITIKNKFFKLRNRHYVSLRGGKCYILTANRIAHVFGVIRQECNSK